MKRREAIFFDVETTGLITNEGLPLSHQPEIIEIGALRVLMDEDDHEVLDEFSTLVRPTKLPLDPVITRITGIETEQLEADGVPLFVEAYSGLAEFFTGAEEMLAHNARFDLMMLAFELRRIGKELQFPFCRVLTDTKAIYPGKLEMWARSRLKAGETFTQSHRALDDCRVLAQCYFDEMGKKEEQ